MAVYKKRNERPNRNRKTDNLDEAQVEHLHKESRTAEVFDALDAGANKTEDFVHRHQRTIIGVLIGLAVIGLGYLLYQQFIKAPKEKDAMSQYFFAQLAFDAAVQDTLPKVQDSLFDVSLKGGKGKYGFLEIIDKYSGTKAANLSHYSAGMAYMRKGNFDKAIEHLKKYDATDNVLGALALGNIGDAYSELKNYSEALNYYKKAFDYKTNDFTTPLYLKKAGVMASLLGKNADALQYFERIKDEYPNSGAAQNIEVWIGKVSQ
ncbi:Tetratricopeptide repeat-containing protein [Capnocytophaga haemolytica]|jgi:tetratricopeptide repeat protein|uniref:Zn-dependent protease, contains TPR repeats n=1 Tax=Capnocytophaga haemolytica TaxID=45243 RepID=A0AAX2H104_9FLAO|nr:tetratricopeptide repeat protein [Capnocytophaga haemolytica]AMD84601.1 hypothetical protein AXF12_03140 [Capnocytophaga haemolytica]SFO00264.1 Tetratricopeptide repeat-containing protein [Capnocytophaga haemolytica]SNV09019.1 Putative Zn-dependent protease, contains TPR repeats [Capnocytophaga haemolytica]